MRTLLAPGALLALVSIAACSRGDSPPARPSPQPVATTAESSSASEQADGLATLSAAVKLVAQEYSLAVDGSGAVKDDTELAEAELFADQARLKYQRLAAQVKTAPPEVVALAGRLIDDLGSAVTARKAPAEVQRLSAEAATALASLGPAESRATAGLRAATEQADRAIEAERLDGDYRIGVVVEPPREVARRAGDGSVSRSAPPAEARSYVGIVLRERRTKRFLPDARVSLDVLGGDGSVVTNVDLESLWGDYPQYGGHLAEIPAAGRLRVRVEPPHHARHGDMLARVAKPGQVEFEFATQAGRPSLPPEPPGPIDSDYAVGDDILQGFAESLYLTDVGDYRIGFIAEAPEPYWLWKEGPQLRAVEPDDNFHVEVILQDAPSGLLVPGATVTVTLTPKAGGKPVVAHLHGLLSVFQHYGETLRVPPGEYAVRVDVEPPALALVDGERFLEPASIEFVWRAEPRATPPDAEEG